jgi:hypothetical protein
VSRYVIKDKQTGEYLVSAHLDRDGLFTVALGYDRSQAVKFTSEEDAHSTIPAIRQVGTSGYAEYKIVRLKPRSS